MQKEKAMPESKVYIGTKVVKAYPMSRTEFKPATPGDGTPPDEPGYCVEYEDGYRSWSPKETFERCYREMTDQEKALAV